eukprot:scaffold145034_cov26-Tisochrysis_lutea.AAC.1
MNANATGVKRVEGSRSPGSRAWVVFLTDSKLQFMAFITHHLHSIFLVQSVLIDEPFEFGQRRNHPQNLQTSDPDPTNHDHTGTHRGPRL